MTDYLFATPSFAEGIARNIDLFGSMNVYNTFISPEADERAYREDVMRCARIWMWLFPLC